MNASSLNTRGSPGVLKLLDIDKPVVESDEESV